MIGVRTLALSALALVACSSAQQSVSFQVEPGTRLEILARQAAQAWTEAGVPVSIASDGAVPIFWVSPEAASCSDPGDDGCAFLDHVEIVANDYAADDLHVLTILLHEMGHVVRGRRGHSCARRALMSAQSPELPAPLASDVAFVRGESPVCD